MSLKAFHIFFIIVSVLLAFGFAYWEFRMYAAGGAAGSLVLALLTALTGIGLVVYCVQIIKKLRNVKPV